MVRLLEFPVLRQKFHWQVLHFRFLNGLNLLLKRFLQLSLQLSDRLNLLF